MRASKKFKIYRQVLRDVSLAHPHAFPRNGRRPPLKVGVIADLAACGTHQHSSTRCRTFLAVWTRSTAYLVSVAKGGPRVGLDGSPAGEVTEGNRKEAASVVLKRRTKTKARSQECANGDISV